ncbi:CLUMA_CG000530, isoform A [Clunio marinus]|uniref:CLUMA_CG000530, isoform A n=1 Tax=Clunio marinus TaxID=568069 RepID=A0A1J1HKC7_9DIPT|nr:CLUMA_CG000530, isoform A [Clunio marinus]
MNSNLSLFHQDHLCLSINKQSRIKNYALLIQLPLSFHETLAHLSDENLHTEGPLSTHNCAFQLFHVTKLLCIKHKKERQCSNALLPETP